jgi:hypothetical protein
MIKILVVVMILQLINCTGDQKIVIQVRKREEHSSVSKLVQNVMIIVLLGVIYTG